VLLKEDPIRADSAMVQPLSQSQLKHKHLKLKDYIAGNNHTTKSEVIEKTGNIDDPKHKSKTVTSKRIRKCSKSKPLPPTKTGVKRTVSKKVKREVKPKLRNRTLKTSVKTKNRSGQSKPSKTIIQRIVKKLAKKSQNKKPN
jgi:hypothetical protein